MGDLKESLRHVRAICITANCVPGVGRSDGKPREESFSIVAWNAPKSQVSPDLFTDLVETGGSLPAVALSADHEENIAVGSYSIYELLDEFLVGWN